MERNHGAAPGLTLNANCTISEPTTATFPTGTWWVNGANSGGSDWSEITIQVSKNCQKLHLFPHKLKPEQEVLRLLL